MSKRRMHRTSSPLSGTVSRRGALWSIVISLSMVLVVNAVKREDFKNCAQSGFCTRNRAYADLASASPGWLSPFRLVPDSLQLEDGILTGDLIYTSAPSSSSTESGDTVNAGYTLEVHLLDSDAVRVRMNERDPKRRRYDGLQKTVLIKPLVPSTQYEQLARDEEGFFTINYGSRRQNSARIRFAPFQIEFLVDGVSTVVLNEGGLLKMEAARTRSNQADTQARTPLERRLEQGMWTELFKDIVDTKPRGPESFGLDITFPEIEDVYGIPEHASSLSLNTTRGTDAQYSEPYRLYNLDVFEYEIDTPMALYGSIPFMLGHSKDKTAGVFWMNAAETWIDIEKIESTSGSDRRTTRTHWFSEAGVLDLFVFLGPTHRDIFRQYSSLVGATALPQSFSIGYHQCRWNYVSQKDVAEVDAGFETNDIPYDVLWLDIEHTNGKRYFTWDSEHFSDPIDMQVHLGSKGRKMVTIIDPHIKMDKEYHISKEATDKSLFVMNNYMSPFDGWCWPGSSQWVDFENPRAKDWWASQFSYDRYLGSTSNLFTWNDMNEPSVFTGPEITLPKDAMHYNKVEHRSIHNIYGAMFHAATAQGLTIRNETLQRPFVLSRAFFAGSQRYGSIWTGDNRASWDHFAVATPMLLTIGLAGLPFSGADVGGFFGDPEPELLTRWYQAGAFYPFFRAHAHLDSKRREPWLFGEPYTSQIRAAIRMRYTLLPLWYTLFQEASTDGVPIIRPMFFEFPSDELTYRMEDQFMVGNALLVKPVTTAGATHSDVYFAGNERWFDFYDGQVKQGPGVQSVPSPAYKIPVYQRAGTIVPKRETPRRSSKEMENDPFTLVIALDSHGEASGRLYLDDGESFEYTRGDYFLREFKVERMVLTSRSLNSHESESEWSFIRRFSTLKIERIVFQGLSRPVSRAVVGGRAITVDSRHDVAGGQYVVAINRANLFIGQDWSVALLRANNLDSATHSPIPAKDTDPAIASQLLMDHIKIAKVNAVQLEKKQSTYIGTLHLTAHHLIFFHPKQEIWISYPTIHTVEKGLPTVHNAWPLHIRCHNFVFVALNFQSEKDVTDVYESIQKLTCIGSVEDLYAFFYTPSPAFSVSDGWQIYDPLLEYERMGVGSKNDQWRFSELNKSYTFSPTYPQLIVVPTKISDNVLQYAAKHRSKARIPALSYLHWNNMASITRSSQPMVGLKQNRSIQDEKLIEAIFMTNVPQSSSGNPIYGSTATNLIVDARPTANAVANTAVGAGTENMENYRNCKKVYSGIDNIHVMRDSLNKLVEALQEIDTKGTVSKAMLQKSGWLKHIGAVMDGAVMIVRNIHISSSHVLVHCSDGWDRTAQLTSVAQICLDPYYRTLRGFQVLVEKEWCSFGYKFMDRCGHLSNDKNFVALSATNSAANTFANVQNKFYNNKHIRETSPIFHQFLDCVFQTMHQNPKRFEFNEFFLTQLHYHVYSCQFGNFLFNCQKDRREYHATTKCASIWDFINSSKEEYLNKDYDQSLDKARGGDEGVLFPDTKAVKYWSELFGRTDEELNSPDDNPILSNPLNERPTPENLGFGSNYAESVSSMEADNAAESRMESDPLGIGSSMSAPQPRSSARINNMVRAGTPTGGGQVSDGEDSWQRSADNLASKFPAALSGAFGGGLVDSFNRLTMNVRDTWYASSAPSGPNNQYGEDSPFADMRAAGAGSQHRAVTLGRSNSNRNRGTVDREMSSISGAAPVSSQSHSTSSSPKHSLADLTLESEYGQDRDPLRSGGAGGVFRSSPSGSTHSSSRSAANSRQQQPPPNSSPKEAIGRSTPRVSSPDLTTTLPSSDSAVSRGITMIEVPVVSVPEPPREPAKELPHPLFVE
ncbi:hypothetical protein BGW39_006025 [Mortierella sp. 14UC]|nr:hypothetical protein BGW39_006025 [Mortierella sp. 14UC]